MALSLEREAVIRQLRALTRSADAAREYTARLTGMSTPAEEYGDECSGVALVASIAGAIVMVARPACCDPCADDLVGWNWWIDGVVWDPWLQEQDIADWGTLAAAVLAAGVK